jgi:hypothetical protein
MSERYKHLINQSNYDKMPEEFQKRFKVNHDLHIGNITDSSFTISSSSSKASDASEKTTIENKLKAYLSNKTLSSASAPAPAPAPAPAQTQTQTQASISQKSIQNKLKSYLNKRASLETQKITDTIVKVG